MMLCNGMHLYHGSYTPVRTIDLEMCAAGKDFGRGFYLTSDKDQARRFVRTSLRKAQNTGKAKVEQNFGYVSEFVFHESTPPLNVFEFSAADEQWLWFVSLNRRAALASRLREKLDTRLSPADVVIGKVANDTTNPVITTYLNGLYGPINETRSAEIAIGLLLPDRLKDQFCFLTQRAVACLEPVGVVRHEP